MQTIENDDTVAKGSHLNWKFQIGSYYALPMADVLSIPLDYASRSKIELRPRRSAGPEGVIKVLTTSRALDANILCFTGFGDADSIAAN